MMNGGHRLASKQPVDTFDCADKWMPALLIEDTQQGRQMGAAIESLRNVVAEVNGYVPKLAQPFKEISG
ncbi:hypothetical protein V1280_001700 [Bradyrhizobium sp. AZCC 2230]